MSRPQKADDYKIELPKDFKPPVGLEFKLDAADPAFGQLRELALKRGFDQETLTELTGLYASVKVGEDAQINAAAASQRAQLGTNGPARVDAVTTWMDASGLDLWKSGMVTAAQVEQMEGLMRRLETQGVGSFSQRHRAAPDADKIPGYENMSFEQRRFAQDQKRAQAQRKG